MWKLSGRAFVRILGLAALATPASAGVLNAPGAFGSVQGAINAANDGDVVLVASGNYAESLLINGRGVILAANGAVTVRRIEVTGTSAGQAVVLDGLTVDARGAVPLLGAGYEEAVYCHDCDGSVRVQDCTLLGEWGVSIMAFNPDRNGFPGLRVQSCADVAMLRGSSTGGDGGIIDDEVLQYFAGDGGDAVLVRDSTVTILGATLVGGKGGNINDTVSSSAGSGGAGVENKSGDVLVSGCSLTGGDGGYGDCDAIFGCGSGGSGGDGVHQETAAASLATRDNSYAPGNGAAGGDGTPSPDGSDLGIDAGSSTVFPADTLSFSVNTPVSEGALCTLSFTGPAGAGVWLAAALGPAHLLKPFNQGAWLDGSPLLILPLGTLLGGTLSTSFTVPELGAGITDVTAWLQVLQDTPAAGLGFTFDTAAVLTLLGS